MKKIISAVLSFCIVTSTFSFFEGTDFKLIRAEEANVYIDENDYRYVESQHSC